MTDMKKEIEEAAAKMSNPVAGSDCREDDHSHDCPCAAWEAGFIKGAEWMQAHYASKLEALKEENERLKLQVGTVDQIAKVIIERETEALKKENEEARELLKAWYDDSGNWDYQEVQAKTFTYLNRKNDGNER